jgi:hypothetical protein
MLTRNAGMAGRVEEQGAAGGVDPRPGRRVGPDRFAWLFAPGPVPADRALPNADDFAAACDVVLAEWQALPAVAAKLLAWGRHFADSPPARRVRDRDAALRALSGVQMMLADRLVAELSAARIAYVFLKGSAVRFTAYADPADRVGKDLDIAVGAADLGRAETIAVGLGFEPAEWDYDTRHFRRPDPVLRKAVEAQHYELGFLARRQRVSGLSAEDEAAIRRDMPDQMIWHDMPDGGLGCYVTLDIHHGLSLDIDAAPIIAGARSVDVGDMPVRVPAPGWLAFQLMFKLYWEGVHNYRKGAYQYADLARMIPMLTDADFAAFADLMREHTLEAAGHYVLRRLSSDLGIAETPALAAFLDRTSIVPSGIEPGACNDYGDMWPKIWGIR